MTDKNNQVRAIIDRAVDELMAIGATRSVALSLLAFQSVIRLALDDDDAALLDLRRQINEEIDTVLTPASDERLQ